MLYHSKHADAALLSQQQQIAARSGLLSKDSESVETTRILGVVPSLCENEVYPWDPAVVRALRRLDPLVVPVGVKYICRTPAHTDFTVFRHALARMLPSTPEGGHDDQMMNVIIPASPGSANSRARYPMIWLHVLEGKPLKDLPSIGEFRPFDWRLFYDSREETRSAKEEAQDRAIQRAEAKAKQQADAQNRHSDLMDDVIPEVVHHAQKLDCTDIANFHQPIEPVKKPFVHVRGA